jgi:hypothetical protein
MLLEKYYKNLFPSATPSNELRDTRDNYIITGTRRENNNIYKLKFTYINYNGY